MLRNATYVLCVKGNWGNSVIRTTSSKIWSMTLYPSSPARIVLLNEITVWSAVWLVLIYFYPYLMQLILCGWRWWKSWLQILIFLCVSCFYLINLVLLDHQTIHLNRSSYIFRQKMSTFNFGLAYYLFIIWLLYKKYSLDAVYSETVNLLILHVVIQCNLQEKDIIFTLYKSFETSYLVLGFTLVRIIPCWNALSPACNNDEDSLSCMPQFGLFSHAQISKHSISKQ